MGPTDTVNGCGGTARVMAGLVGLPPRGPRPRLQRRLAVAMATDVAGYSCHLERDTLGTALRLRRLNRRVIRPLVAAYRGLVINDAGDSTLTVFDSARDAVLCAVGIQQALAIRGRNVAPERQIRLRIGICAGEVLLIDGAVYGAPVNIAARLQALACPGGICASEGLLDAPDGAAAQRLEPLGRHELHNIARPVLVYRIAEPAAASDAN